MSEMICSRKRENYREIEIYFKNKMYLNEFGIVKYGSNKYGLRIFPQVIIQKPLPSDSPVNEG